MSAAELHITPSRATSSNGLNLDGAKWFFYQTGTSTPQSVYTTAALNVAHSNPVVADAAGKFPNIFFDASLSYRGVLKTADDVTTIYDIDPINNGEYSFINTGTGAVATSVQDELRRYVYPDQYGTLQQALTEAATSGRILKLAGSYEVTSALTSAAVRIECEEPTSITYTGVAHIEKLLAITMAGSETSITGKLILDANDKANIGLFIQNSSATRADVTLGNIEARNCRMVSGNGFNAGAAGIVVRGNVDTLQFQRLWAAGISRAAGTGSISNYGTSGVTIDRTAGYAAKVIKGMIIGADDVTTDDSPGVAACVDVDGVAIFQNDEDGAACDIDIVISNNAQGRGFKGQIYRSGHVELVSVTRSISGITGGSLDIDFQLGEGCIDQANVVYSGNADTVHGQGTTCASVYTDTNRTDGYALGVIRNLTVKDKCSSGTATINALCNLTNGSVNTSNKFGIIENVQLLGRTAKRLVDIGQNGASGRGNYSLKINGVMAELTAGVISCNGIPPNLRAVLSQVWNTGSSVPPIYRLDAVALGSNFGKIIDGGGNVGVKRYRGTGGDPGILDDGVNDFTTLSVAGGLSPLVAGNFAQSTPLQSDKFGITAGSGLLIMGCPDFGPPGIYTTSGNTITTIQAASGVNVSSTGSSGGGIDFNVWKTDSGTRITVENAGVTTRPFFALVIG